MTGVQTCALPICKFIKINLVNKLLAHKSELLHVKKNLDTDRNVSAM